MATPNHKGKKWERRAEGIRSPLGLPRKLSCLLRMSGPSELSALVEQELQRIADAKLEAAIPDLLVTPYPVERSWDYGTPDQKFTCWTVLEHRESDTGIAVCHEGFGPAHPWGLVFLTGDHMSIGVDSGWFVSSEEAMRDSMAWDGENPASYESS